MFFAEPRTHAVPLFLETKQLPISFLLFEQKSPLMYDVHNNVAPDNIKNMFTKLSSVHSCRTRTVTNENYYVEQVNTWKYEASLLNFRRFDLEQYSPFYQNTEKKSI